MRGLNQGSIMTIDIIIMVRGKGVVGGQRGRKALPSGLGDLDGAWSCRG